jgi:ribosomal protein S9
MANSETAKNSYFYALGRRKSATARVRLTSKKGSFIINDKPVKEYFADSKQLQNEIIQPFNVLELDPDNQRKSKRQRTLQPGRCNQPWHCKSTG